MTDVCFFCRPCISHLGILYRYQIIVYLESVSKNYWSSDVQNAIPVTVFCQVLSFHPPKRQWWYAYHCFQSLLYEVLLFAKRDLNFLGPFLQSIMLSLICWVKFYSKFDHHFLFLLLWDPMQKTLKIYRRVSSTSRCCVFAASLCIAARWILCLIHCTFSPWAKKHPIRCINMFSVPPSL